MLVDHPSFVCFCLWSLCTVDIDECQTGEANCSQLCDNVPGSFVCKCRAGYSLQGDGATCAGMHAFVPACMCGVQ